MTSGVNLLEGVKDVCLLRFRMRRTEDWRLCPCGGCPSHSCRISRTNCSGLCLLQGFSSIGDLAWSHMNRQWKTRCLNQQKDPHQCCARCLRIRSRFHPSTLTFPASGKSRLWCRVAVEAVIKAASYYSLQAFIASYAKAFPKLSLFFRRPIEA